MPFGISSAPEVFQLQMHELVKGLQGMEVTADDFVVVRFGHTHLEAIQEPYPVAYASLALTPAETH